MITLPKEEYMKKLNMKERLIINKSTFKVALISLFYGLWLMFNQNILSKYLLYELMKDYISPFAISSIFIMIGTISILSISFNAKSIKNISSILITMLWSTWTISFFITPPPNSVWVFSIFITCLSYEAIWADRL